MTEIDQVMDDDLVGEETSLPAPRRISLWYYTMPLESKEAKELIPALREIVLKINLEFQCQAVYRVHADQAQELTGSAVKNALMENNVLDDDSGGGA